MPDETAADAAADQFSGVTWMPSDYQDEVIPPPRSSPDAWLTSLEDGTPALAATNDLSEECESIPLADGEIVLFDRCTGHGVATLTLAPDGSHEVDDPMPQAAQQCCVLGGWQAETLSSSPSEAARALLDADADAGEYSLAYYTWESELPFRFDAAARTFTPVARA